MSKTLETGDRSYIILYCNSYGELRCLIVSCGTTEEAEEIAGARGIKPVGVISAKKIVSLYTNRKPRRRRG